MNSVGIEPELRPDCGAATFTIKVTHGINAYEVAVPANSSFGDLKSIIAQKVGLKPEMHKLLFRGKEKEDDDDLQTTGVKDNSKVLIVEDTTCRQKSPEEVKEASVISQGCQAVALVREQVDMLSEQVSALQAIVDDRTKVDDKDIVYLTEMLMRQLLQLDSIVAEGEGRVQRKMEVRRIQSLVETMDILKLRNSNPPSKVNNTESLTTTQCEKSEPGGGSVFANSQIPSFTSTREPSSISSPEPSTAPTPVEFPADSTPSSIPALTQFSAPMPSTTTTDNP